MTGGRFVISHGHAYEIEYYDARGLLQRIARVSREPVRVDASIVDDYLKWLLEKADSDQSRVRIRRAHAEDVEKGLFAETLPTYDQLLVGPDGGVWARRYAPPWREERDLWDVFDAAGRLLGSLRAPPRLRLYHIGADHVAGVARDEFDVEYVQVHRLIRSN